MSVLTTRIARLFVVAACSCPAVGAEAQQVRGVNPADIDTRFDVIGKYNWLPNDAHVFTTTLKYDYRATSKVGLNFELPVLGHFHSPSMVIGPMTVPSADDWGIGDVFARIRYIDRAGQWSYGGAIETAFPTATQDSLGTGKFQLNPAALAVYAWSPSVITAGVVKSVNSIGGEGDRADIRNIELRGIQAFMFPNRMFVTLDLKHTWELINAEDRWWDGAGEVGYQFNPQLVGSIRASRKWGDRDDRGAIEVTIKSFF